MSAALDYTAEAFSLPADKPMGRQSAGESFLKGFVRHSGSKRFTGHVVHAHDGAAFARQIQALAPDAEVRIARPNALHSIMEEGTLFCFHPVLPQHAWTRRAAGEAAYSLCGLTHTLASHAALDAVADMLIAPMHEWDALICPSRAIKAVVEGVFDDQQAYLSARMQAAPIARPQLPVIPLGINTDEFTPDAGRRAQWRKRLGLAEDEVAVIYVGRLSLHAKANPLPMYMALEQAARATGKKVRLLLVGWFANERIADTFKRGAVELMPSVKLTMVDGTDADSRMGAWSAADIFFQLSDNIQESFGLSPIEAMAAQLPAVVSDWDGFRDTIVDGETGYRAPTLQPFAGAGKDLATRYDAGMWNYDTYIASACQSTAVSIRAAGEALTGLIQNPERRMTIGAAGRKRAQALYDWNAVIPQYQALWQELAERRKSATPGAGLQAGPGRPGRTDPYRMFAGFPTEALADDTVLVVEPVIKGRELDSWMERMSARLVGDVLLDAAGTAALVAKLAGTEMSVGDLLADVPADARPVYMRTLGWMLKFAVLSVKESD